MWFSRKPKNETILPPYDFSEALLLPVMERFERSIAILQGYDEAPMPLQPGFSEDEIVHLEKKQGVPFASEVREFLRHWKRVEFECGFGFYGPDSWVTEERFGNSFYLVIGDYWRYADGDLLLMPLSGEIDKVLLYMHEAGPKIEELAPTFSLAWWRLAHE